MLPYGNIFADVQTDNAALGTGSAAVVFRCGVFNTSCASSRFFAFEKRK
jgi:heterodisulfide reductase subunit C